MVARLHTHRCPNFWQLLLHARQHSTTLLRSLPALPAAACCRGAEATAEELATLQERALWELLALFFLDSSSTGGGGGAVQGAVAQVGRAAMRRRLAARATPMDRLTSLLSVGWLMKWVRMAPACPGSGSNGTCLFSTVRTSLWIILSA